MISSFLYLGMMLIPMFCFCFYLIWWAWDEHCKLQLLQSLRRQQQDREFAIQLMLNHRLRDHYADWLATYAMNNPHWDWIMAAHFGLHQIGPGLIKVEPDERVNWKEEGF